MTWHQTIIVGNLGGDPEMRYLPSGTAVTNFTVAVNERWTSREGEPQEKTTWYRISVFGKQAETVNQYLSKGRQVMVIGTVEANAFMGNDGQARASLDLRAREVRFLQGGDGGGSSRSGDDYDGGSSPPEQLDDIPF